MHLRCWCKLLQRDGVHAIKNTISEVLLQLGHFNIYKTTISDCRGELYNMCGAKCVDRCKMIRVWGGQ